MGQSGAGVSVSGGQGGAKGAGGISVQERTRITSVFKEARVEPLNNVTFSIAVGTRIPRDVHLHALPAEVLEIHPAWKRYEYILVRNEIIVVNPGTFTIVAVLPLA